MTVRGSVSDKLHIQLLQYGQDTHHLGISGKMPEGFLEKAAKLQYSTGDGAVSQVDVARASELLATVAEIKVRADAAYARDGVSRRAAIVKAAGGFPTRREIRAVPRQDVLELKRADRAAAADATRALALLAGYRACINDKLGAQSLETSALEAAKDIADDLGVIDAIDSGKAALDQVRETAGDAIQDLRSKGEELRDVASEKLADASAKASELAGAAKQALDKLVGK